MNYDLLIELLSIPDGLDRTIKKEQVPKKTRELLIVRDRCTCQMCGLKGKYGNPGFDIPGKLAVHHIIPNGSADLDNLITICNRNFSKKKNSKI